MSAVSDWMPQVTPEGTRLMLAAGKSDAARWAGVRFRDNTEPSTRRLPPHCGGCWCGGENGHDWPGKEDGQPHPRLERSTR